MRILQLVAVLGFVLLFGTGCASLKEISETQKAYGIRRMPNAEDFPNSDAVTVIESHLIDMNFDTNDNIYTVEETHVIQKVFRNLDKYANVEIILDNYDKLQSIEARTINSDGQIVTLLSTDFHTATGVTYESEFVSDRREVRFAFKNVQKGSVLEYKYKILTDFRYGGLIWRVQQNIPTLVNVLRLSIPKYMVERMNLIDENHNLYKWDWIYKAYSYEIGEPTVEKPLSNQSEDEQKYIFTWKLKKIHSFIEEPLSPPYIEIIGHVRFAEKTTWNGIASRYMDRFWNAQAVVTSKVIETSNQIIQGATNDEEKVRRLTDYVKSIRYTSIQLGDGGYAPRKPQEVLDTQYGDCKDKATLLISMLRNLGIIAKPVLVRTYGRGTIDPDFPRLGWFNHMIVKVELQDQVIWIDPTSENSQFGELPWSDEGVLVCVLDSGKANIEKTPIRDQSKNMLNVDIRATPDGEMNMNFHFSVEYYGNSALYEGYQLKEKSSSDLQKYCKGLIADDYLNAKIQNTKISNREGKDKPLTLEFDAIVPNAIQQQGDLFYANIDPFKMFNNFSWLTLEKRIHPIRYDYPYTVQKKIRVKFADVYRVRNLPKTMNLSTYDFDYWRSYENQSNAELVYAENYTIKSREIPSVEYPGIKTFFSRIQSGSVEKVVLTK